MPKIHQAAYSKAAVIRRKLLPAMIALWVFPQAGITDTSEALVEARRHAWDASINAVTFRHLDDFYPTAEVLPGKTIALDTQLMDLAPTVTLGDKTLDFEAALLATYTNALLVIDGGKIVYERYFNGGQDSDQFISWSMAKSITSILFGIALAEGHIGSLSDTVETYLPDLVGSAYEGVTIEQMLLMRAGTDYSEVEDLDVAKDRSMYRNQMTFSDVSGLGIKRINEPGSTFNYSTLTTGILGRLLEEATGQTLAQYTQEKLWQPAGMEAPAAWLLDNEPPVGRALAGGGFNAVLRDYGRIGLLMLNDGVAGGEQVVPRDWVRLSTNYPSMTPVFERAPRGYQYQWWTILGSDIFEAIGIFGQFLSIDRSDGIIIVKLSHWPEKGGGKYNMESLQLLQAIREEVRRKRS